MIQACKLFTIFYYISISFFYAHGETSADKVKKELSTLGVADPLINEIVEISPVENHHFNLEAPQECGKNSTPDLSSRKIKCQFHSAGEKKITVSVCDNDKRYCKQEYHLVQVQTQSSSTPRMAAPVSKETQRMQYALKSKLMKGFENLTPEQAGEKARGKKGILAVVSTDWCPPCNVLKEFLFSLPEFEEATKDYVKVYVDGDSKDFSQWRPYVKSFYYPSLVLLTPKLEVTAFKIGAIEKYKFVSWLEENSSDSEPLENLRQQLDIRIAGGFLQSIKDLFTSAKTQKKEADKIIDWLRNRNLHDEAIVYMEALDSKGYADKILESQYYGFPGSSELSPEEQAKAAEKLAKQILDRPAANFEYYFYIALEHCKKGKDEPVDPDCREYLAKAIKADSKRMRTDWNQLTPAEKKLRLGHFMYVSGNILALQGETEKATKAFTKCENAYGELKQESLLKEKSRVARIQQLYCFDRPESVAQAENEPLLLSLAEDYPVEETFHRKLAKSYKKKKQYNKALAANELAIKYSYGKMWMRNVLARVGILQEMGKIDQAMEIMKVSMKEISLDKNVRKMMTMKSFRAKYEELKKLKTETL